MGYAIDLSKVGVYAPVHFCWRPWGDGVVSFMTLEQEADGNGDSTFVATEFHQVFESSDHDTGAAVAFPVPTKWSFMGPQSLKSYADEAWSGWAALRCVLLQANREVQPR